MLAITCIKKLFLHTIILSSHLSMKHYLRKLIIVFLSLYLAFSLVPTIHLGNDPKSIVTIIAAFFLMGIVIRPIFSLILIPLNFITVGLVSFILNILTIFALTTFVPGVLVGAYNFPGANLGGIILQPTSLNQITTVILLAALITVSHKVLHLIFE